MPFIAPVTCRVTVPRPGCHPLYEIQLFGPLEVRTRGVRLSGGDLGGDAPRHILALPALRGKVRTAEPADLVWQGRPPTGHPATLEGQLSLLRHHLDPGGSVRDSIITASNGGYALVAGRVHVDVARFDELVAAAAHRPARGALRPLTAAAHVAARPLLEDVAEPEWAAQPGRPRWSWHAACSPSTPRRPGRTGSCAPPVTLITRVSHSPHKPYGSVARPGN